MVAKSTAELLQEKDVQLEDGALVWGTLVLLAWYSYDLPREGKQRCKAMSRVEQSWKTSQQRFFVRGKPERQCFRHSAWEDLWRANEKADKEKVAVQTRRALAVFQGCGKDLSGVALEMAFLCDSNVESEFVLTFESETNQSLHPFFTTQSNLHFPEILCSVRQDDSGTPMVWMHYFYRDCGALLACVCVCVFRCLFFLSGEDLDHEEDNQGHLNQRSSWQMLTGEFCDAWCGKPNVAQWGRHCLVVAPRLHLRCWPVLVQRVWDLSRACGQDCRGFFLAHFQPRRLTACIFSFAT